MIMFEKEGMSLDIKKIIYLINKIFKEKHVKEFFTKNEDFFKEVKVSVTTYNENNDPISNTYEANGYYCNESSCKGKPSNESCIFYSEKCPVCVGWDVSQPSTSGIPKLENIKLEFMETKKVKELLANKKLTYAEYLQTKHWERIKIMAKKKADHRCQLCNNGSYLYVHHRTYAHLGDELNYPSDVVALCKECHELLHIHKKII